MLSALCQTYQLMLIRLSRQRLKIEGVSPKSGEKPPHFQADFEHKQLTYDKKSLSNFYDFTVKKKKDKLCVRNLFTIALRQRMSNTIGTFSVTFKG